MSPELHRPYTVTLSAIECGALVGAAAWVLGALQILRDRGHAEQTEELHALHDGLAPLIEQVLDRLALARAAQPDAALERTLDQAYTRVRVAFETWIELTALDTVHTAIEHRLAQLDESDGPGESAANGPGV